MKTITSWSDLKSYGIELLTGEACGLTYRYLCDVTAKGKQILEKAFSVKNLELADNWNPGSNDDPHIGSILLPPEMLIPLGIFALLESGCTQVWLYANNTLLGIDPDDAPASVETWKRFCAQEMVRTFAYRGTAGDRNLHVMSGRVQ